MTDARGRLREDGLGQIEVIDKIGRRQRMSFQPIPFRQTVEIKHLHLSMKMVCMMLSLTAVRVTNGDNGATWMQEDVAIEFARWMWQNWRRCLP